MSFRRPKGGRRVVEDSVRKISVALIGVIEIFRFTQQLVVALNVMIVYNRLYED